MPEPDMRTLGLDMLGTCDGWEGVGVDYVLRKSQISYCWELHVEWRTMHPFKYMTCDPCCVMLMRECESHHCSGSFIATIACFDQASLLVRPRERGL